MSIDLLARIERDLSKMGEELWNFDGPDDVLDKVLERLLIVKAQLEVQKSLQATANLLRRVPIDKALPKQQATKVKHLVRFAFRKNSRQELLKRGKEGREDKEGRHRRLRKLDCDALKLCGLSYTTDEIVKIGDAEFEILQKRAEEFICHRNLSSLLYRPDVDKAVDSKLEDPEDDELFDNFIQTHTARRLSTRKRKYDAIASPNESAQAPASSQVAVRDEAGLSQGALRLVTNRRQLIAKAPTAEKTNTESIKYGDVFALKIEDARYALSCDQNVTQIFVTNPKTANKIGDKSSFLTAWISEDLGELLSKRGQPVNY